MKTIKTHHSSYFKGSFPGFSLILLLVGGLLIQSCIKKEDFDFDKIAGFEYSPNGAAPLVHSKLTLRDILQDYDTNHLFVEDGTHFLSLIYNSTVFSKRADEFIFIENQFMNTSYSFSTGAIANGDSMSYDYPLNYSFSTGFGERYDSIVLKSGTLGFSINADINHNARIYITIPGAKKNGQVFKKTILYNYTGSTPVVINQNFNLDGYTISFTSGNQLAIDYKITVYGDGNPNLSPYNVNLGESIQSMFYDKIYGYLGQLNFGINQDSVFIDIFKNNIYGSMYFEDPRLNLVVSNAYGMPVQVTIDLLRAESSVNPPFVVDLAGSGIPYPWDVGAPTFAQMGQSVQSSIHLDQTNSNVKTAINISPHYVSYHVNTLTNPYGNPLTDQNFVIDTSRFSVDAEVELPMYGSAWDFRLQDTLDFSFGEDIDILDWVLFKINTDNGFPVDASMQIYFADSLYNKLDSLLVPMQQVISSGIIGPAPDYKVVSPTHKLTTSKIEHNRIMNLLNVEKMLIYAKLETVNNGGTIIKMYSDYFLDVKIGMQAQIDTWVYPSDTIN